MQPSNSPGVAIFFGEVLIDVLLSKTGAVALRPGGAPANAAAAAGRAGRSPILIATIGNDGFGDLIARRLDLAGVSSTSIRRELGHPTSLAVVAADDAVPRFAFYRHADLMITQHQVDETAWTDARVFTFGSLSLADGQLKPALARAIERARIAGCLTILDANFRSEIWPNPDLFRQAIREQGRPTDVLKVNHHEAAMLTRENNIERALQCLRGWGYDIVLLTRGHDGCAVSWDGRTEFQSALSCPHVVDDVGAGDAFIGALAASLARVARFADLLHGDILMDQVLAAQYAAAQTLTKVGAGW